MLCMYAVTDSTLHKMVLIEHERKLSGHQTRVSHSEAASSVDIDRDTKAGGERPLVPSKV